MNTDLLDGVYEGQRESPFRRYGKRIAGGIACSAFVAFLMHLSVVKAVILWACTIVLMLFGRPSGAEKLDRIEDKVHTIVVKGQQAAKEGRTDGAIHRMLAPVQGAIEIKKDIDKAKEKVGEIKEKVDDVKKKGVETIKETGKKVEDKAKEVGTSITDKISGLAHGRSAAKEKAQRETLEAHAAVIGLKTDPDWTLPRLQAEVLKAELKWQAEHGPNAQCTNPKCSHAMRFNRNATGNRRCPRCGNIFSVRTALALGASKNARNMHVFGR